MGLSGVVPTDSLIDVLDSCLVHRRIRCRRGKDWIRLDRKYVDSLALLLNAILKRLEAIRFRSVFAVRIDPLTDVFGQALVLRFSRLFKRLFGTRRDSQCNLLHTRGEHKKTRQTGVFRFP